MNTLDRYLSRQVIATTLTVTAIGLAALLLERLMRLFDLFAGPDDVLRNVGTMVVLLAPHYLGIALPAAFFFGVLLTFGRLNRDNELPALMAAGSGLPRLLKPTLWLAVATVAAVALIIGFLQPYARYAYRALKHDVAEASLSAAVKEGAFIQAGNLTFFAETAERQGSALALTGIFVLEEMENGTSEATTARRGTLLPSRDGSRTLLRLRDGLRTRFSGETAAETITFDELTWPVETGNSTRYRPRGGDRRELTLPELWQALADPPAEPGRPELLAELNGRVVVLLSTLVLPVLAAALAVRRNRRGRDYTVLKGLLILLVYHKALDFGDALVKREVIGPLVGLWLPFAALLLGTALLYREAAFVVPDGRSGPALLDRLRGFGRRARAFAAWRGAS